MDKRLILLSALYKKESIQALETQLVSLFLQSSFNTVSTDILIITQPDYQAEIESRVRQFNFTIQYFIVEPRTDLEASSAKLRIFECPLIHQYSKVLYLDSYSLIYNSLDSILDLDIEESKLYAIEEGWLTHPWWGGNLFHQSEMIIKMTGFSMNVLLFKVSDDMKILFKNILNLIDVNSNKKQTNYLDQPYIIFQAVSGNKYDNTLLKVHNETNNILTSIPRIPHVYNKTAKIDEYIKDIYTKSWDTNQINQEEGNILKNKIYGKHFRVKELSTGNIGSIDFNLDIVVHLGPKSYWGKYTAINAKTCNSNYGNQDYLHVFNSDNTFFISIRKSDLAIIYGYLS
jgi:alpha-N-acetylglucosamine transferase